MAFKKFRNMKVYEQSGYNYKSTPTIMLKGQWLKEAGFNVGDTVTKIKRRINPNLEIAGILLTMCEKRTTLCKVLTEEVMDNFQGQIRVFETKIPSTVKVGESIYYGKPLEQYSPKASAGVAYRKLAKELIFCEG